MFIAHLQSLFNDSLVTLITSNEFSVRARKGPMGTIFPEFLHVSNSFSFPFILKGVSFTHCKACDSNFLCVSNMLFHFLLLFSLIYHVMPKCSKDFFPLFSLKSSDFSRKCPGPLI